MLRAVTKSGRGVAAGVLTLLLAGCVRTELVPLSSLPAPDVEVVRAEQMPPSAAGGELFTVSLGQTTLLEGWVPRPDAELVVVADQPLQVLSVRRLVRPPTEVQVTRQPPEDATFRLIVRSEEDPLERVCVLAEAPSGVTVLAGSDPAWCPVR